MSAPMSGFVRKHLQSLIADQLFPSNRDDWYVQQGHATEAQRQANWRAPFDAFLQQQRASIDAPYHADFQYIDIQQDFIDSTLVSGNSCKIETLSFRPDPILFNDAPDGSFPAKGKHIVYFTGMGTVYQNCFHDISVNVKTTGATVHAFNYPGLKLHGGPIAEANDMVNSGIAMVNHLLQSGVDIDDIVLQGDSFGAAVAYAVKQQFLEQSDVKIRAIVNNTFSSFTDAAVDTLHKSDLFFWLDFSVAPILSFTGWDLRTSDTYLADTPYQCQLQHIGDLTLPASTLADKVMFNKSQLDFDDPCPVDYRAERDALAAMRWLKLKAAAKVRLVEKYGVNEDGQVDAHLADLYQLETLNGEDAYQALVNRYLAASQAYVDQHPQQLSLQKLPSFITRAPQVQLSRGMGGFFEVSPDLEEAPAQEAEQQTAGKGQSNVF